MSSPVTTPTDSLGVTVVIVSYRTPDLTMAAVQGALAAGAPEVVVVDNDSGDSTVARLETLDDPRLIVVTRPENGGFGVAANAGARRATTDTLIFLNSDATLSAAALAALRDEIGLFQGRCVAGPRLIDRNGVVQPSAGLLPGPVDLTVRALGLNILARYLTRVPVLKAAIGRSRLAAEYGSALTASRPFDTSMVSGACCAIGKAAFSELGFDERFFLYFEDADFCRRARRAGMHVRYVPDAVVTHIGGASSADEYHFSPPHARAMRQYLEKWYGVPGRLLALTLLTLRAMAFGMTLRPGSRRAWAALRAAW